MGEDFSEVLACENQKITHLDPRAFYRIHTFMSKPESKPEVVYAYFDWGISIVGDNSECEWINNSSIHLKMTLLNGSLVTRLQSLECFNFMKTSNRENQSRMNWKGNRFSWIFCCWVEDFSGAIRRERWTRWKQRVTYRKRRWLFDKTSCIWIVDSIKNEISTHFPHRHQKKIDFLPLKSLPYRVDLLMADRDGEENDLLKNNEKLMSRCL